MKSLMMILCLVMAAPLSACGAGAVAAAPAVIAEWLPAIFSALGTAESAVNTIGMWANRFKDMPGVAAQLPQLNALLQSAREDFQRARELAMKGAEFEQDAKQFYRQGAQTLEQAVALITELGMFRDGKLVRPPDPAPREGCPRTDGADEMRLELPPNQV